MFRPASPMIGDNIQTKDYSVAASNATAIYKGDLMVLNTDGTVSPHPAMLTGITAALSDAGIGNLGAGTHYYRPFILDANGCCIWLGPEQAYTNGATATMQMAITGTTTGAAYFGVLGNTKGSNRLIYASETVPASATTIDNTAVLSAVGIFAPSRLAKIVGVAHGVYSAKQGFDEVGLQIGARSGTTPSVLPATTAGFVSVTDSFDQLYFIEGNNAQLCADSVGDNCAIATGAGNAFTGNSGHVLDDQYGVAPLSFLPVKIYAQADGVPQTAGLGSNLPVKASFGTITSPLTLTRSTGTTGAGSLEYRLVACDAAGNVLYVGQVERITVAASSAVQATYGTVAGAANYYVLKLVGGVWTGYIYTNTAVLGSATTIDGAGASVTANPAQLTATLFPNQVLVKLNEPTFASFNGMN